MVAVSNPVVHLHFSINWKRRFVISGSEKSSLAWVVGLPLTGMEIIRKLNLPMMHWFLASVKNTASIGCDILSSSLLQKLLVPGNTKIIMLIMDGLGGLPCLPGGKTELETAQTPNLDALAERSSLGLTIPVAPGITPGSGPSHLAIFGYDPLQHEIGRGAMEALGVDFDLGPDDLAARGNFCTVDTDGRITDRRAGRIGTDINQELARLLETIRIEGAEIFIEPVKEHRFAFIMRSPGLDDALSETDPQKTGVAPLPVLALDPETEKAARYVNQFIISARKLLADKHPANM